jgi:hypothetical protein
MAAHDFDRNASNPRDRDQRMPTGPGAGGTQAAKSGGGVKFRTPSGSVSAAARRSAESRGDAMPGGRFPIRNASDLSNAKHDFARANDKPAVRRWINKRARDLGEPPMGG